MTIDETVRQKQCSTCRRWQPLTEFNKRWNAPDGRQPRCRSCSRDWYVANRERHIKNVRKNSLARIRESRRRIYEYLLAHPCVDCGEADPCVLDFDHVRGRKINEVSRMTGESTWTKIAKEIEKCEVRCANCHRRITGQRAGWYRARRHGCAPAPRIALTDDLLAFLDTYLEDPPVDINGKPLFDDDPRFEDAPLDVAARDERGDIDEATAAPWLRAVLWAPRDSDPHASD